MADQKISQFSNDATPSQDDLIPTIHDPGGTPINRQVTLADLLNPALFDNPYKFHATKSDAQNSTTNDFVKVTFATEAFDTNGNFASSTYTVPVNGFYQIIARVDIGTNATGILALYKNGSEYKRGSDTRYTADRMGLLLTIFDQFAANDTLDIYVFDNSTSAISAVAANTFFMGYLVCGT